MDFFIIFGAIFSIMLFIVIGVLFHEKFFKELKENIKQLLPENKIIHTIVLFTLFLIILNVIQYSGFEIKTILTQLTFNIDFFDIAFHNFSYLFNFMIDGARLAEQIIRITFSGIYYISVVVIAMSLWKIANKNSLD